jgi:hypothetical protein
MPVVLSQTLRSIAKRCVSKDAAATHSAVIPAKAGIQRLLVNAEERAGSSAFADDDGWRAASHVCRGVWVPGLAEPVIGPAREGRTRWLARDDGEQNLRYRTIDIPIARSKVRFVLLL